MHNCLWKKMKHLNNNEKTFETGANSMRVTTNSNLCGEWRIRMPKNAIECRLKCGNRYWIWFTRKWSVFLSLKNATSGNCSPFHANGCVFSASGVLVPIFCLIYCWYSEYPQRGYQKHNILVTGILKTRGYPKRCDTFRLTETWSFLFISDNFSEVYG